MFSNCKQYTWFRNEVQRLKVLAGESEREGRGVWVPVSFQILGSDCHPKRNKAPSESAIVKQQVRVYLQVGEGGWGCHSDTEYRLCSYVRVGHNINFVESCPVRFMKYYLTKESGKCSHIITIKK